MEVCYIPLFYASKRDNCAIDTSAIGYDEQSKLSRVIDLDIDIGADAVDYKCVFQLRNESGDFHLLLHTALLPTKNHSLDLRLRCENWKA
jgi:hypothetical protein